MGTVTTAVEEILKGAEVRRLVELFHAAPMTGHWDDAGAAFGTHNYDFRTPSGENYELKLFGDGDSMYD